MDESDRFDGRLIRRDDPAYEAARRGAVWNARLPDRRPDAIVQAASEEDVARAVRLAGAEGMRIGVRSGGHSWAANHVRDGGLLLDLSALRGTQLNVAARTARVQPGTRGNELLEELAGRDLFFPAGHCPGVALGGYLLQGGYGWNGRVHGPACMSVAAIDVVTADGRLLRADERENPDLLWAARGAGPGFFGVVTGYHLRLQPLPPVIANGVFTYPGDCLEEVFRWAAAVAPQVPRHMELMVIVHRDEAGEVEVVVTGPVLADDEEQARSALSLLEDCPARERAKIAVPYVPASFSDLYAGVHASYPDGHRYAVDNMWTHAAIDDLMPHLRRAADTLPPAPSHLLWMNWGPGATPAPPRPDMAYSSEDDTYIALYGVWADAADDAVHAPWAASRMREAEGLASGIQLADENLGERPARFASAGNMARLDELRSRWDPEGRFHPWMGRL
jgi:FAD/FMN-containing dehydrogenase